MGKTLPQAALQRWDFPEREEAPPAQRLPETWTGTGSADAQPRFHRLKPQQ